MVASIVGYNLPSVSGLQWTNSIGDKGAKRIRIMKRMDDKLLFASFVIPIYVNMFFGLKFLVAEKKQSGFIVPSNENVHTSKRTSHNRLFGQ